MLESEYDAYLQEEGNDETHMTYESRPTLFSRKPMRTIFKHNLYTVATTRLIDFGTKPKTNWLWQLAFLLQEGANKSMET